MTLFPVALCSAVGNVRFIESTIRVTRLNGIKSPTFVRVSRVESKVVVMLTVPWPR